MRIDINFSSAVSGKPSLIQITDTGTNDIYIDGTRLSDSSWQGSGNYTITKYGTTYTFKKYEGYYVTPGRYDGRGTDITLKKISNTSYEFVAAPMTFETLTIDNVYPVGSMIIQESSTGALHPDYRFPGTSWSLVSNTGISATYKVFKRTS